MSEYVPEVQCLCVDFRGRRKKYVHKIGKHCSKGWATLTGVQLCTVFCCKDCYGSVNTEITGNEESDRLARTVNLPTGLQLGRAEVLRGLGTFLDKGRPERRSTDCLRVRRNRERSGRRSTP